MLKVNIMIESLNTSQEAFTAISYANTLNANKDFSVSLFTESSSIPVIRPNCAIFPIEKALYTNGVNIATSLSTGRFLKNCIADKKVLYLWEPEWIYRNLDYIDTYRIINNAGILISQCNKHNETIYNLSGRKSDFIIPNFDLMEILNAI